MNTFLGLKFEKEGIYKAKYSIVTEYRGYYGEGECLPIVVSKNPAHKTMFITSKEYSGDLGGLKGADAICQYHAKLGNLSGIYKAMLSDSANSAKARLFLADIPYRNVKDVLIYVSGLEIFDEKHKIGHVVSDEFGKPAYDYTGRGSKSF